MHYFPPALGQKVIIEACRSPPKGFLPSGLFGDCFFGLHVFWLVVGFFYGRLSSQG